MPAYTTVSEGSAGRRQIIVALVFLALALVLTYLPQGQQQGIASALRVSVLRPFVATQEGLVATRDRATAGDELRGQLDSLVAVMSAHTTTVEENRRLRALLSLTDRVGASFRPASVVRAGTAGSESMFLLNIGGTEGVRPNAPVITRNGLLGAVREVQSGTSIGMDWTHPDFRASAMTLDGMAFGIVESRRGDFREDDRLVLNGTAFHTTLDRGTVVVTSGLGGIFPRGIPIGMIDELAEAEAGWRKSYWLTPFVSPGGATHVLVATAAEGAPPLPGDLSSVWPRDSIVSYETLAQWDQARRDSLSALGDSVRIFRQLLLAYQVQDSGTAASLEQARADSAARAARVSAAASSRGAPAPAETRQETQPTETPARATPTPTQAAPPPVTPVPEPRPREPEPAADTPRRPVIRPALPPPDTVRDPAPTPFPRPADTVRVGGDRRPPPDTTRPRDTLRVGMGAGRSGAPLS